MKRRSLIVSLKRRARAGKKSWWSFITQSQHARIGLLCLTLVTGLFYVLQMNMSATKGYDIRELEQRKTALQKEGRQLELEAMELESVERILAQLPEYQLVEATPDAFVSTATATFASR
jgi:hypothetical protein